MTVCSAGLAVGRRNRGGSGFIRLPSPHGGCRHRCPERARTRHVVRHCASSFGNWRVWDRFSSGKLRSTPRKRLTGSRRALSRSLIVLPPEAPVPFCWAERHSNGPGWSSPLLRSEHGFASSISQFQVAMHDAVTMRLVQRVCDFTATRSVDIGSGPIQARGQGFTLE